MSCYNHEVSKFTAEFFTNIEIRRTLLRTLSIISLGARPLSLKRIRNSVATKEK